MGIVTEGVIVTFRQTVNYRSSYDTNNIAIINQEITSTALSSNCVIFKQQVELENTFYTRNGWDVMVQVGSLLLTTDRGKGDYGLCDDLTITGVTNSARNATFSFIPPEEMVPIEAYAGQEVQIYIRKTTNWESVFFGYVNLPRIKFIERKVTLSCDDNRKQRLNYLHTQIVKNAGEYNINLMGEITNTADEFEKRMTTSLQDFNFDRFGNPRFNSWTPKVYGYHTIASDDVLYTVNPDVDYTDRSQTTNTITVNLSYTYQRLHQQGIGYLWLGFTDFIQDYWQNGKPSFPARETIISAANGGGWHLISSTLNFTPIWEAGGYGNSAVTSIQDPSAVIIWQPNNVTTEQQPKTVFAGYLKDSLGAFVTKNNPPELVKQYDVVLDANGKPVMETIKTTIEDTSSQLCRGAQWLSARHFAQTVTENYSVKIVNPVSVAKYQEVATTNNVSITDEYDTAQWEASINSVLYNFYVDQRVGVSNFKAVSDIAFKKAKRDILSAHRDVSVSWTCKALYPLLDVGDTIDVSIDEFIRSSTAYIYARGVTQMVSHRMNFTSLEANTEIQLILSRNSGSVVTEDDLVLPEIDIYSGYIHSEIPIIQLNTYLGVNPDPVQNPAARFYKGWVGNKQITPNSQVPIRSEYAEQFIVDYPEIPAELRDTKVYPVSSELEINIPNDDLEVSF